MSIPPSRAGEVPSPLATYLEHLGRGQLSYQFDEASGRPVFPPRVLAPGTGSTALTWKASRGLGTVYATTMIHVRNAAPYNVALIDLDEGFRMMSRVEAPGEVRIGQRVRVKVHVPGDGSPPHPMFEPVEA